MPELNAVGSVGGEAGSALRTVAPRRPREWWAGQYRAWRASGKTCAAFCAERGINASSFDNWCGKFRREAREPRRSGRGTGTGKFVAVKVSAPSACTGVTLSDGEVSIRFEGAVSAEDAQAWVRMLRSTRC